MVSPKILTKVINVELTDERQRYINRQLGPVTRLVAGGGESHTELVIRCLHESWHGATYYALARIEAGGQSYYAVAQGRHFRAVIREVRGTLRRAISQEQHSDLKEIVRLQNAVHEKYYRRLFA